MPDKEQKNAIFYLLLFVTDFIIQIHSFIKSLFISQMSKLRNTSAIFYKAQNIRNGLTLLFSN